MKELAAAVLMSLFGALSLIAALTLPGRPRNETTAQPDRFPLDSYYFESRVTSPGQIDGPQVIIKGWFQAPNKTRWEISCSGAEVCDGLQPRILLVVGGEYWFYEPDSNTYVYGKDGRGSGDRPFPLLSNFQPGPLTADAFPERLAPEVPKRPDSVLGISVTNYAETLWIDEKHAFMLRQKGHTDTPFDVEVTHVEYDPRLPADVFKFAPPPNAIERPAAYPQSPPARLETPASGAGRFSSSDFLRPDYLPGGYTFRASSGGSSAGFSYEETRYVRRGETEATLLIRQQTSNASMGSSRSVSQTAQLCSRPGLSQTDFCRTPAAASGTPIAARGYEAFTNAGQSFVTFKRDGFDVTISSGVLTIDELVRVADSLK